MIILGREVRHLKNRLVQFINQYFFNTAGQKISTSKILISSLGVVDHRRNGRCIPLFQRVLFGVLAVSNIHKAGIRHSTVLRYQFAKNCLVPPKMSLISSNQSWFQASDEPKRSSKSSPSMMTSSLTYKNIQLTYNHGFTDLDCNTWCLTDSLLKLHFLMHIW